MLKFGVISEVDLTNYLARVYFEEDDFVSPLLKMSVPRAKGDQFTFPFAINEHVWCVMDENWEYGVIGGAVYDETNMPSGSSSGSFSLKLSDNSLISYDANSHTLNIDIKGTVTIKSDHVTINSTDTVVNGPLKVNGAAIITGIASVGGLAGIDGGSVEAGDSTIKAKSLEAADEVSIGSVGLKNHKHTVPSGGGISGPPQN